MKNIHAIRILTWDEALPLARPIREQVFIQEQGVARELEWDDRDALCDHAVAFERNGRAIGTARLLPEARIGRMAVLREWRGRGVGAALLAAMLAKARERGMTDITLHAQKTAAGFYRKFGFSERGREFLESGIAHVEMGLNLERSGSGG